MKLAFSEDKEIFTPEEMQRIDRALGELNSIFDASELLLSRFEEPDTLSQNFVIKFVDCQRLKNIDPHESEDTE